MNSQIRVTIVEDLEPMAIGMKTILEEDSKIIVKSVLCCHTYCQSNHVSRSEEDIILFGCSKGCCPPQSKNPRRFIIFQNPAQRNWLRDIQYGIPALVSKNNIDELMIAIQGVLKGGGYLSQEYREVVYSFFNQDNKGGKIEENPLLNQFTKMEREVIKGILEEKTNQEIAASLYISKRTVEHHITSALRKTNAKSRVGLAIKVGNYFLR